MAHFHLLGAPAADPADAALNRWQQQQHAGCRWISVGPDPDDNALFAAIEQAIATGHPVKAVLAGPLAAVALLCPPTSNPAPPPAWGGQLDRLVTVLQRLAALNVPWVQFNEPILGHPLPPAWRHALETGYRQIARQGVKILLATPSGSAAEHLTQLVALPIDGFHIDLAGAPEQLRLWLDRLPPGVLLSAGVIDGATRSPDLARLANLLAPAQTRLGDRLLLAPTACSHADADLPALQQLAQMLVTARGAVAHA